MNALLWLVVADIVVVLVSGLASMTEAAFLSLPATKAHAMTQGPKRLDRVAGQMRLNFVRPLATIVVINNVANIGGASITGVLAKQYFDVAQLSPTVSTLLAVHAALLTLVVILAGEIIPKTIGERHAQTVCRYTALPVRWARLTLTPIIWLIGHTQRPFLGSGSRHLTSEDEIRHLTSLGQQQGAIDEFEGDMIHRVLRLDEITAEEIMVPRVEMVALDADLKLADVAGELDEITRSRIPLYRGTRDNIVAILDRADSLSELAKDNKDLPLTDERVAFKAFFVPESMPADHLLVALQRRTNPMAIVVGDYGETVGLVTLEDVIEELVGEILDEGDIGAAVGIERVNETQILCLGRVDVSDVNEALGTDIPGHRTLAGMLLDEMERIPKKGDTHEAFAARFTIAEATEKAIVKVRVERLTPPDGDGDEGEAP